MAKYDNKCGSCSYSEYYKTIGEYIKIYCTRYGAYYWADESCNNYAGSYIATAICNILGKKDHMQKLETIKQIRTSLLDKDIDYRIVIERYDRNAPLIAKKIKADYRINKDKTLAQSLFDYYIQPTVNLYNNGQIFEAIEKYSKMCDILEEIYGFKNNNFYHLDMVQKIKQRKIKRGEC